MVQQANHSRMKGAESKRIAGTQLRWARPIFSSDVVVTRAKDYGRKTSVCVGVE